MKASGVDEGEQNSERRCVEIVKASHSDLNDPERYERDEECDEGSRPDRYDYQENRGESVSGQERDSLERNLWKRGTYCFCEEGRRIEGRRSLRPVIRLLLNIYLT